MFSKEANQYASDFSSPLTPLLQEVLDYTWTNHPHATMVSGHEQGLFLQFISRMVQPKRMLEIGTFTGFSALCLAEGLAPDGELHTLELREADAKTAQGYFNRSPKKNQLFSHVGNALEIIPHLQGPWDLVFIDADKVGYIDYYEMVVPQLSATGWILADNVLFHGEVLKPNISGKNAVAIAAFNEHVRKDDRVEQVLLTIRDGVTLIRRR